ncbi:hypothetical protein [Anabaena sp. CCY 0017]|uniref:hypothetical protein n=1 Tax=Anabaena sp. CCY 0017 TaxID=3103866 RepID=UPI0039C5AB81
MIISDLNILESVETVSVVGGYYGGEYNKKGKGYYKNDVYVDFYIPVEIEQEAENYSYIYSKDDSYNYVKQENEQKAYVYQVFENIGNITKVGY